MTFRPPFRQKSSARSAKSFTASSQSRTADETLIPDASRLRSGLSVPMIWGPTMDAKQMPMILSPSPTRLPPLPAEGDAEHNYTPCTVQRPYPYPSGPFHLTIPSLRPTAGLWYSQRTDLTNRQGEKFKNFSKNR